MVARTHSSNERTDSPDSRLLQNMETNLWREATHMWYMGWPSRGVPDDPSTIIAFLIEARAFMRNPSSSSSSSSSAASGAAASAARKAAPHVVHCSPGTGRTGTVLAIDLCVREFETARQVDVPRTVYRLRKDRAGCVQTKEQYMFIYKVSVCGRRLRATLASLF